MKAEYSIKITVNLLILTLLSLLVIITGCRSDGKKISIDGSQNGYNDRQETIDMTTSPQNPSSQNPPHDENTESQNEDTENHNEENPDAIDWASQWYMETSHGLKALGYIEHINNNFYERLPFSYQELDTAMWIMEELLSMGYDRDAIEFQSFHRSDVEKWLYRSWEDLMWGMFNDDDEILRMFSQNIILTVPGQTEQTIIVGAHYDSMLWPGGNDNASGVALLLENAYTMLEHENYYTIIYVFFGAEELNCLGAYYYYESLNKKQRDDIVMMVNADVLLSGEFLIYSIGDMYMDIVMENDISQKIHSLSHDLHQTYELDINSVLEVLVFMGSDHRAFLYNSHTVLLLSGAHLVRESESENHIIGNYGDHYLTWRSWHDPEDCIIFINETWTGMAEINMWSFSLFLEAVLLMSNLV